jgi:2-iminobutanoate/2-iminopropanoate deaminase
LNQFLLAQDYNNYLIPINFKSINLMKKIIHTRHAPAAIGPYSQAVEINGTLYISGQIPVDPETGKIVDGGIKEQTRQVMMNIGAILKEAGYEYSDVVKSTCLLSDMDNFKEMNEIYGQFYPENQPARAAYGVVKLPMGVLVEIETIAALQAPVQHNTPPA